MSVRGIDPYSDCNVYNHTKDTPLNSANKDQFQILSSQDKCEPRSEQKEGQISKTYALTYAYNTYPKSTKEALVWTRQ